MCIRDSIFNALNNFCVILNVFLLTGFTSAMMVCAVAVVQSLVAMVHVKRDTPVTRGENVLFLVLYIGFGLLGLKSAVDLLPTVGAVFSMLATFQRSEQRTRLLLIVNASTFAVYYVLIRSTALIAVLCTIASCVLGLLRDRKKQPV